MLSITQFDLSYPGYPPLARVTWHLKQGEQVALLGRSGTGKSTLLKAILHAANHPHIEIESDRIAYLAQQPVLLPWLTVAENVSLGNRLRGESVTPADAGQIEQRLIDVGLAGFGPRIIDTLSGGQRARVALARVLFEKADCVLLDEPFSGLDRSTRIHMASLCRKLLSEQTVILVTHDPLDARNWLSHAMVLTENDLTGPFELTQFEDDRVLLDALGVGL